MERNLKQHTVSSFDVHLKDLSSLIEKMSVLAIKSVDIIEETISGSNKDDVIEKIIAHDKKINKHNHEIENEAVAFIALRQPKAYDLRLTVSAIKVASNLERIGDYAKNVVKKIAGLKISPEYSTELLKMTVVAKDMIKDSVYSLLHNDLERSKQVLIKDDEIDKIYYNLFSKFKDQELNENSRELVNILFIAKAVERLADHAENIAQIVNYTVTGKNG